MSDRKGIVLAGGRGSRLHPLTCGVSKQLLPVYDKPMIYYPVSTLMLAGIREILITTVPEDEGAFRTLLGDGSRFGLRFFYVPQEHPEGLAHAFLLAEEFLSGAPSALVLGDNLFYGHDLIQRLQSASRKKDHATIFAYEVSNPCAYGVVEMDEKGMPLSLEEKPAHPKSNFAVPGLYFYPPDAVEKARTLRPSNRGELEITDLNRLFLEEGSLRVQKLGRGTAWLDTGTQDDLLDAAEFVRVIQRRQGLKIACLEEIALRLGYLSVEQLRDSIAPLGDSGYTEYLRKFAWGI